MDLEIFCTTSCTAARTVLLKQFVFVLVFKSSAVFPQVAVKLITGQEQGSSCIELKLKEVRMKTQIKMTFAVLSIHSVLINATIDCNVSLLRRNYKADTSPGTLSLQL